MDTTSSKIKDPSRIRCVLEKMCDAKMYVLLKFSEGSTLGVRARFNSIHSVRGRDELVLDSISPQGSKKLEDMEEVRVEVQGMPSRVVFRGSVSRVVKGMLCLKVPSKIISVERRQNTRYSTTPNHMAYVVFPSMELSRGDPAAPPQVPIYQLKDPKFSISDLSISGACFFTHYYSIYKWLVNSQNKVEGKIIFPMISEFDMTFLIRWQKRTTNSILEDGQNVRTQLEYRVGLEFSEPIDDDIAKIRQFMRALSMADAI